MSPRSTILFFPSDFHVTASASTVPSRSIAFGPTAFLERLPK